MVLLLPSDNNNDESLPKATHGAPDHPLRIGNLALPCYVLDNGKRVLVQRGMISALGMSKGGNSRRTGDRLARFVTGKRLEPFISKDLAEVIMSPILFKTTKGATAYGYEATILADMCDSILAARKAGALQGQQLHIAEQCEILVRAFARVGIIALVDEATGYQEVRAKDELHQILKMYVAPELRPWLKTFPNEYYEQLFRLRGWHYSSVSVKRPKLVGKLTNEIVYEKLPPGILEELQRLNPIDENGRRKYKHHQRLTDGIGKKHLERHLASATTLMRISPNWNTFKRLLDTAFPSLNTVVMPIIPGLEDFVDHLDFLDDNDDVAS